MRTDILCTVRNSHFNSSIRGTFLVDNSGKLQTRVKRGENIQFIVNYLFSNPCAGLNDCRKALMKWRGIKNCDASRGQYASYFYDFYSYKWYHEKKWTVFKDKNGKKRAKLTVLGMSMVDLIEAKKINDWLKSSPRDRVKIVLNTPEDIDDLTGYYYDNIFSIMS
jgi:hypothetical protein